MHTLLIALAILLVLLTLAPLSNSRQWYIRACDFPRVQIVVLSLIWLVLWITKSPGDNPLLAICAVCMAAVLAYQLYWITPNTQLHNVEVQHHVPDLQPSLANISLLSSNVLMHNRNAQPLLRMVHEYQPDILITLETDQWWQDQLDILESYPHRIACPLDNLYGMHIYSRLELTDSAIDYLVEPDKPSMSVRIGLSEHHSIQMHVVHPAPPAPQENLESIERDVELIHVAKSVATRSEPVIVAGDLNDVAWSATTRLFRELSGLKDPRIGRGIFNTFSARHWFIRWPLDHVFVSEHFRLVRLKRLPDMGSDHFPLFVELALVQPYKHERSTSAEPTEPELLDDIMNTDTARDADAPTEV